MPQIAPITAAIFCGRTKPKDVRRFMKPLVHELNMLMDVGMVLNNRRVTIKVRAIIADSPARAFLKGKYKVSMYLKKLKDTNPFHQMSVLLTDFFFCIIRTL